MPYENLYQETILDHYRNPRNFSPMPDFSSRAERENANCGDNIEVMLRCDSENELCTIQFQGQGCAVSIASASMMTERLSLLPFHQAEAVIDEVLAAMTDEKHAMKLDGDLAALKGIVKFPVRRKCASLAWEAARDAIVACRSTFFHGEKA